MPSVINGTPFNACFWKYVVGFSAEKCKHEKM